jgi:hypothetical protein
MGDIVLFQGDNGNLPAHIANAFGTPDNSDLSSGIGTGYPIISIKGKVFHVVQGDDRQLVTNEDGDAKSSIDAVILKANPGVSKVYYRGGYVEGSDDKPACYSNDGKAPALDAQEPQCSKCAICPHNAWGSRVTETGAKGKACSDSRRLAVAPLGDLENPMLLRIPAATLKDLTAYAGLLTRRGVKYQAVVTKIGFDHSVAHPKLTFKPTRFLSDVEAGIVVDVLERPVLAEIVGLAQEQGEVLDIAGTPPKALMKPEPEKTKPAPAKAQPKHLVPEADAEEVLEPKPAPKADAASKAEMNGREPKAAAPKAAKPAAAKPATAKPVKVVDNDESLDDILASLENDD